VAAVRVIVCMALLMTGTVRATPPIPHDRQIPVKVLTTLAAPADQTMHMPTDVTIDATGNVIVADGANDRVASFTSAFQWNGASTEYGKQKLSRPVGVTMDRKNRLWIANSGLHQVLVVEADGSLDQTIDLPVGPDHPSEPTDVALTSDNRRAYIVDNDNHRLIIRDNDTGELHFMGKFGEAVGQFRYPFMISADAENYMYISEAIGARVQRVGPADKWAGQIGRWGVELGQIYRPKGVVVTPAGQVLIGDSTLSVIQAFSKTGVFQGILCDADGQPRRFKHPMGMAFDRQGRLYVVELKADRIAVIEFTTPPTSSSPAGTKETR
jgi:DNA-binding beta-propeller fold protein YncE